jgi:hypothetical protein
MSLIPLLTPEPKYQNKALPDTSEELSLAATAAKNNIAKQREKLLRIALQTCACLLLNLAMAIYISSSLEKWAQDMDVFLECSLLELSSVTPDRTNYGFSPG